MSTEMAILTSGRLVHLVDNTYNSANRTNKSWKKKKEFEERTGWE